MDLEQLQAEDIDLSIIYRDTPPDFKTVIKANDVEAVIWKYKVISIWLMIELIIMLLYH